MSMFWYSICLNALLVQTRTIFVWRPRKRRQIAKNKKTKNEDVLR